MSFLKNIFGTNETNKGVSKIAWRQLTDLGQLNEINIESGARPVVIFKHSTTCHISRAALKQFENEFDYTDGFTLYFLDLLAYRGVSNEVATRFEVVHQSPQLLVIKAGKAVYSASHESIAAAALGQFV